MTIDASIIPFKVLGSEKDLLRSSQVEIIIYKTPISSPLHSKRTLTTNAHDKTYKLFRHNFHNNILLEYGQK